MNEAGLSCDEITWYTGFSKMANALYIKDSDKDGEFDLVQSPLDSNKLYFVYYVYYVYVYISHQFSLHVLFHW